MKKFTYPSLAVISLNSTESVMYNLLSTGETDKTATNVIEPRYDGSDSYTIWRQRTSE